MQLCEEFILPCFFPTIDSPKRITTNSKALINDIFYNDLTKNIISENITTSISDHLTQFLLISNQNPFSKKPDAQHR